MQSIRKQNRVNILNIQHSISDPSNKSTGKEKLLSYKSAKLKNVMLNSMPR